MKDYFQNLSDIDFIQEHLDFSALSPADLENLVFHLIDEMGFSNIHWRKGGEGNSATDGGRDLEANFWSIQPISTHPRKEKYWFEVKFRKNQLEKLQIQKTVLNASGDTSINHLLIITNSTISNPTLDWIKAFVENHKTLQVTVWQGHDLELLLRRNPKTSIKFFPTSLSLVGRCRVIESKFLYLMILPSINDLIDLWNVEDPNYEPLVILSLCISEISYGNIIERPWGFRLKVEDCASTILVSMENLYMLAHQCSKFNRSQELLFQGISYLVICLLLRWSLETTAAILLKPQDFFKKDLSSSEEWIIKRVKILLHNILDDLAMYCSSINYCKKLSYKRPKEQKEYDYFAKFNPEYLNDAQIKKSQSKDNSESFLVMQSIKEPCKLELVNIEDCCPLAEFESDCELTLNRLIKELTFIKSVILKHIHCHK